MAHNSSLLSALSILCLIGNSLSAASTTMHTSLRHIGGRGVGYNTGYSSLDGFFALNNERLIPFVDLRGHVFNDGKYDVNAGLGFRALKNCRSWGGSAFYDFRAARHHNYQQIGLGLETLGEKWDLIINGYLPVGGKKSPFFDTRISTQPGGAAFSRFSGQTLFILPPGAIVTETTRKKRESALKGVDALVRFPFCKSKNITLSGALGSYYLHGYYEQHALGVKAKICADWKEFISLRIYGSYDKLFGARIQGEIALSYPFGSKSRAHCSSFLERKVFQSVDRAEIIALHKHKTKTVETLVNRTGETIAIDPETGDPYVFWFVDNTSHSNGTYESPFNTLAAATSVSSAHDIIYIFPGDGTTTGLDAFAVPFQLKDSQQLLGAGYAHPFSTQFGEILTPALASGQPHLTADSDTPVVVIANGNTVSGLYISASGVSGGAPPSAWCVGENITGSLGITGFSATNNLLQASGPAAYPIQLENTAGMILLSSNTIQGDGSTLAGIEMDMVDTSAQTGTIFITNNTITNMNTSTGLAIVVNPQQGSYSCLISGNTITNCHNAVFLLTELQSILDVVVESNRINSCSNGFFVVATATSSTAAAILSNTVSNATGSGGFFESSDSSTLCLRFQNNSTNLQQSFDQLDTSIFNLEPYTGNNQSFTSSGTITSVPQGTCGD